MICTQPRRAVAKKEEEPPVEVKTEEKAEENAEVKAEEKAEPADKAQANKSAAAALKAQLMGGGAAVDDSQESTHSAKKQKTVSHLLSELMWTWNCLSVWIYSSWPKMSRLFSWMHQYVVLYHAIEDMRK